MNTATMSTNTTSADFSELSCKRLDIKDKTQKGNEGDNHNFKTDSFGSAVVRNNATLAVCLLFISKDFPLLIANVLEQHLSGIIGFLTVSD